MNSLYKKDCQVGLSSTKFSFKNFSKFNAGFTLIELLIVLAIVSFLTSVFFPTMMEARAKGEDARRISSSKAIQTEVANQTNVGTLGYTNIFNSTLSPNSEAAKKIDTLANNTGLVPRFNGDPTTGTDFDAYSDATSFALVIPLKTDPTKYWCVDAEGTSKQVNGRLDMTIVGTKNCNDATVASSATSSVFSSTGSAPIKIALDSSGNVFVTNFQSNTVTKITSAGVAVDGAGSPSYTFASTGSGPQDIVIDSSNIIYTLNTDDHTVSRIATNGTVLATYSVPSYSVAMDIDASNNLYIVNNTNYVTKINSAGTVNTTWANIGSPSDDVTVDSSGNIYTASVSNIYKITPAGSVSLLVDLVDQRAYILDTVGSTSVYAYTNDLMSSGVLELHKIDIGTGSDTELVSDLDDTPQDMIVSSSGVAYLSIDPYTTDPGHVQKVTSVGVTSNYASTEVTPWGLALDSAGNLFVANMYSNTITKIQP